MYSQTSFLKVFPNVLQSSSTLPTLNVVSVYNAVHQRSTMLSSSSLLMCLTLLLALTAPARTTDGVSSPSEAPKTEEKTVNLARAAALGNSNIAAGASSNSIVNNFEPKLGPPPAILSFEFKHGVNEQPNSFKETNTNINSFKETSSTNVNANFKKSGVKRPSRPHIVPLHFQELPDPLLAFSHLEYLRYVLDYLFSTSCGSRPKCDLRQYKKCTCVSPAQFTEDGRGNCNLGVTKADKQVWCYVDPKHGPPQHVCPDAVESSSRPGLFWSRIACITE